MKLSVLDICRLDTHKVTVSAGLDPATRRREDEEREAFINEHCRASDWAVIHSANEAQRAAGQCFANYYFTNLTDATYFKLAWG